MADERQNKLSASTAQLSGKVAIVTGAGRGLGRSYALGLSEAGAAELAPHAQRSGPGPKPSPQEHPANPNEA